MIVGGTLARVLAEMRHRVEAWRREEDGGGEAGELEGEALREAFRRRAATGEPLEVTLEHRPPAWQAFDDATYRGAAYPTYAWGCDVVEVEVDPDTLAVTPIEVTAVCEVGKAIHPRLCAGQIEGGTLQALGWALMEEIKVEDGRYLNDRLATYIIPTIRDTPPIRVELLEKPWAGGPFGAKGIGELPMDGAAPAAAAAVEQAAGVPVTEIPATPERLLAARGAPAQEGTA
jgi:CO/xanthine dehydrogenase Mo-binding subunit